jgi:hypothetical protein
MEHEQFAKHLIEKMEEFSVTDARKADTIHGADISTLIKLRLTGLADQKEPTLVKSINKGYGYIESQTINCVVSGDPRIFFIIWINNGSRELISASNLKLLDSTKDENDALTTIIPLNSEEHKKASELYWKQSR